MRLRPIELKAALIADDLTGTNNAGVLIAKQGLSVITVPYRRPLFPSDYRVACIDTDSRYVAPQEARRRVADLSQWALGEEAQYLCKRVDNLLRGNIGAEVQGMLDAIGKDALAIVAPAFPALGRLVDDGHLTVGGAPVTENPVAVNDPFAPVRHSRIADLLAEQAQFAVAHVGLGDLRTEPAALAAKLTDASQENVQVVIVDQKSDADVALLAEAIALMDRPVFPVDPGPLSAAYLRARARAEVGAFGRKVLAVIGSVTPVTLGQIKYVLKKRGLTPVYLDAKAVIAGGTAREDMITAAVRDVLKHAVVADLVVLTSRRPDDAPLDLGALSEESSMTAHQLSKQIAEGLAETVVHVVGGAQGTIGGCFCTGGDVTAALFDQAGTKAIRIFGDIIPLTAHVAFMGGELDGLQLVTKGGSIGDEDALDTCFSFLEHALKRV